MQETQEPNCFMKIINKMNAGQNREDIHLLFKERLLCKSKRYYFCYKKGKLILKNANDKQTIQSVRIHSYLKSFSIYERIFRCVPRCAIVLNEEEFLYSDSGSIFRYSVKNNTVIKEHDFLKGMRNPLSFCVRKDDNIIIDVLYGEYIWNLKKVPVSIYRRQEGDWIKVFDFPSNSITHIHTIIFDQNKQRYLILTGDEDKECGIWESNLDFSTVKPLLCGAQKYRACFAYSSKDGIYYATDTPLEQNYLYKLENSGNLLQICPIPGPCIFSIQKKNCSYFATSVEGNPLLPKWRYMLSRRLGAGVKNRYVHVIKLMKGESLEEVVSLKKDFLPMGLFQFGNVLFPQTDDDYLYIVPQSLALREGTYIVRCNNE